MNVVGLFYLYNVSFLLTTATAASTAKQPPQWLHLNSNTTVDSLSKPLPYTIVIPNTPFFLHIGFGERRKRMVQFDMGGILALANDTICHLIGQFDEDTEVPFIQENHRRTFREETQPHRVRFGMVDTADTRHRFTLGLVRNVIIALYTYLVEGSRFWNTVFEVTVGPRYSGEALARGVVKADYPTEADS